MNSLTEETMLPHPQPARAQMLRQEATTKEEDVPLEPTSAGVGELQKPSFRLAYCCNGTTYLAVHPVITEETDPKVSLRDWNDSCQLGLAGSPDKH